MSAHLRLMDLVNGNMGTIRATVESGRTAVVVCDVVGDSKRLARDLGGTGEDEVFPLTNAAASLLMRAIPTFRVWLSDSTKERVIFLGGKGTVPMEFGTQGLMPVDLNLQLN